VVSVGVELSAPFPSPARPRRAVGGRHADLQAPVSWWGWEGTPLPAHALRGRVVAWFPAIAGAGLIFMFSAQPNLRFLPDADMDFLVRKAGHIAVFGILALLAWRALATTTALRRPWAPALVFAALYAITDELHQGFVAGRHPSPVDVGIDATGALIAVVAAGIVRSRRA
jgi:hypothetical protein